MLALDMAGTRCRPCHFFACRIDPRLPDRKSV